MQKYANRWPYETERLEAPDEQRCQFRDWTGHLCGLGRYPGFGGDRCIFHLPADAERPDNTVLRFALQEAVGTGAILCSANLRGAGLGKRTTIPGAYLWCADLQEANLWGGNLRDASLTEARLQRAQLGMANLEGANLAMADLQGAYLWKADLTGGVLQRASLQNANLSQAILQKTDLSGAELQDTNLEHADLREADLRDARITGEANLSGADLTDAHLQGVTVSTGSDLDGVNWGPHDIVTLETHGVCHMAERVYRQIKRSYEESGDYRRAGDFFFREMECKRKAAKPWSWDRVKLWFMGYVCGYGERPANTAVAGLALFVVFTFIHAFLGLFVQETANGRPVLLRAHNLDIAWHIPGWTEVCELGKAAYFSIVTFASLGYGNLLPAPGWGEFVAGLEVVLGVFLMALFLVTFTRKFQR